MTIFATLDAIASEFVARYPASRCKPLAAIDADGQVHGVRFLIGREYAFGWGAWLRRAAKEKLPNVPVEIQLENA